MNLVHSGRSFGLWLVLVAACCSSVPAHAQEPPPPSPASPPAEIIPQRPAGGRAPRLYFAMVTTHLRRSTVALSNNWVIGLSGRGYFGATFLNSYGRRAFTGGIQRTIVSTDRPILNASLGIRVGFITGYDGRLTKLARKTPVLPLAQPFAMIEIGHLGAEVSYTIVVISAALSYRF